MAISRTRYNQKRLPERQFKYEEGLLNPVEPYMHNEIYPTVISSSSSSGSLYMPANWVTTNSNLTYTNNFVYGGGGGGSIQWGPAPTPVPAREKTPLEWLDEQVGAVCRRSGL